MGADGGVVTDAADEATFIQALVGGKLGVRQQLLDFYGARGSNGSGCPGDAFLWIGANDGGWSYVYSDHTGKHVAVLLLNGARRAAAATSEPEGRGRRARALLRHLRSRRDPPNSRELGLSSAPQTEGREKCGAPHGSSQTHCGNG